MERSAGSGRRQAAVGLWASAARLLAHPELVDENRLRLGVAAVLSLGAVYFFRLAALPVLAAALLVGCLAPPRAALGIVFVAAGLAVLVEGRLRQVAAPLAVNGVLVGWVCLWLWRLRTGLEYARPFDLRPLAEPVALWVRFARDVDPVRLYTGNVPGPVGATSFGLIAICVLLLAYARRTSWPYLAGCAAPVALMCLVGSQPLTIYLLNGQALLFAGVLGAETRRLPLPAAWRAGSGLAAGAIAAVLLARGAPADAYGAGVTVAAVGVSLFQLFGLAGSPPVVAERPQVRGLEALKPRPGVGQLAALVVFAPVGLVLVWRDPQLARREKVSLVLVGSALYLAAAAGSLLWIWSLRIPG